MWEFDFDKFDFNRSSRLVIERVIERGNLKEWREMILYYGREKVLAVARQSKQLGEREKNFTEIFIDSEFHAA